MTNRKLVKNLVTMVQAEEKAKTFRIHYPVSDDLRTKMVNEVFSDFATFAYHEFYDEENLIDLKEFVQEYNPTWHKRQSLLDNLFWWGIMYQSAEKNVSCIGEYLSLNRVKYRNRPFMSSWLRRCDQSVSSFYFIAEKFNDCHFLAIDIFTEELLEVFVCIRDAIPPKKGEITAGTLLPLGGGLYFPIVDFYHFDYEAREAMASCIHHHFDQHSKKSPHEAFLHVLSVMLQIEKIQAIEN